MAISSISSNPVASVAGDGVQVQAPPSSAAQGSAVTQATPAGAGAAAPSPAQIAQAVKHVNEAFTQMGQNLYASLEKDQATGINIVKFQDKTTREVVSQYPSKAIIAIAESFDQSAGAKGQLLNVRA